MSWRTVPLTAAHLRAWAAALPEAERARAVVAVGLDEADTSRRAADLRLLEGLSEPDRSRVRRVGSSDRFLPWDCPAQRLAEPAARADVSAWAGEPLDLEVGAAEQPPPLRLLVQDNVVVTELVPLLYAWDAVASVVLPAAPVAGSLRRRPWEWPFRVGVLEHALGDAVHAALRDAVGDDLADVSDLTEEPGNVDLVVIHGPVREAVRRLEEVPGTAGAVLVLDRPSRRWPVVDAALAAVRAHTGARVTAIATGEVAADLPRRLGGTLRGLAHGHPLDVALAAAFDRQLVLVADPAALETAELPRILARQVRDLDHRLEATFVPTVGAEPPPPPVRGLEPPVSGVLGALPSAVLDHLDASLVRDLDAFRSMPQASFRRESMTASAAPPLRRRLEERVAAVVESHAPDRFLQAYVGEPAAGAVRDNVLRPGPNVVDVFIGPEESDAVVGPDVEDRLVFDEHTDVVRLSAVLVPLIPRGDPQRAEIEVPRTGRSSDARFVLDAPTGERPAKVQARLILLHRNRVIETALLSGETHGAPARLVEDLTLWRDLSALDDRRPFDAAVVLNRDDDGVDALVAVSDGSARVASSAVVQDATERLRRLLIEAAGVPRTGAKAMEAQRALLVRVALAGRNLHTQLEDQLGTAMSTARRIQIVTARADHFLPLELVYSRRAPAKDAEICPRWLAGAECGPSCFTGDSDMSVVCPQVFWGLSKVIERHYAEHPAELGGNLLVLAEPRRRRRRLAVGSALLGASRKIKKPQVTATLAAFGDHCAQASSWEDWHAQLQAHAADVLVLMPHTNPVLTTMEIAGSELERGYIEADYVNGDHDTNPLVLLLGCDTAGFKDDPAGYASTFMARSAAAVLGSLTMLAADQAADLAGQLATLLRAPRSRATPVGELVTQFRRAAVRSGIPAALALCSYGDADWTV